MPWFSSSPFSLLQCGSSNDSSIEHIFKNGGPQSWGFPIKDDSSSDWSWVENGIFPDKLLCDTLKCERNCKFVMLAGMVHERWFLDKFKKRNQTRLITSAGIFPVKLLDERSIPLSKKSTPSDKSVGFCFSLAHEEAHQIRPKSLVFCWLVILGY